ncbi:AAA-ATPase At2g18190-like [Rutidosis leptorrhynchoides]|uniref:AAA-ATPase At2g18190-like n=1 Tax=Rutidosis leptorrhynchoides TaxID=125765 RepID=UPI003A9A3656
MISLSNAASSASKLFSFYASLTAFLILIKATVDEFVPYELRSYIHKILSTPMNPSLTLIFDELVPDCIEMKNEIFESAETYLDGKISPKSVRLTVGKPQGQNGNITISVGKGEEIPDQFGDIKVIWRYAHQVESKRNKQQQQQQQQQHEWGGGREGDDHDLLLEKQDDDDDELFLVKKEWFELSFNNNFKDLVLKSYLPHVMATSKQIKDQKKEVKIYTPEGQILDGRWCFEWNSIYLDHPSTFHTLAIHPAVKKMITDDLDWFLKRKEFYKKVGKVWNRSYLLYGVPGTGKTSLITAIANYLKFDIYEFKFDGIDYDGIMRKLLRTTGSRSILVMEDIDCIDDANQEFDMYDVPFTDEEERRCYDNRDPKPSINGLLNFANGLWSSWANERIFIFTTNQKDRLDPALLHRFDMQINMSYCNAEAFQILVSNYLGESCRHNPLFDEALELIESVSITPAELAGELIKIEDSGEDFSQLVNFLHVWRGKNK